MMAKLTIGFGVVLILLGAVGIFRDGERASDGADPSVLRAGAGDRGRAGDHGGCEAADAVDAHCGDGGAAGVSGRGVAGDDGVW